MDLQTSIHNRLDIVFKDFLQTIAEHFELDFEELCNFADTVEGSNQTATATAMTCMHRMISGKNKGNLCPKKAMDNGYCSRHQNSASVTVGNIVKKTAQRKAKAKEKGPTKTQLKIIEWLNTAVPQEETILRKKSKGLHHEETDLLFTDDYIAFGRLDGKTIVKLTHFEVELCEKRGWKYDPEAIDAESDSDSGSD